MEELSRQINMYHYLYIICLICAIFFLVLSIFLFLYFRIDRIVGDLTGRTARKAIQQLAAENEQTGRLQKARPKKMQMDTKVTMTPSGRIVGPDGQVEITQDTSMTPQRDLRTNTGPGSDVTARTNGEEPTDVLGKNDLPMTETIIPQTIIPQHTEPKISFAETQVLSAYTPEVSDPDFVLDRAVILVHTDEVITEGY